MKTLMLALAIFPMPLRVMALAPVQSQALVMGTGAAVLSLEISGLVNIYENKHPLHMDWDWTTKDTVLQVGVTLSLIADMMTTLDIRHHPNMYETNMFLGRHPSDAEVKRLMIAEMVGHAVISRLLPNPYRNAWQMFTIGMEVNCVTGNIQKGLKLRVPF